MSGIRQIGLSIPVHIRLTQAAKAFGMTLDTMVARLLDVFEEAAREAPDVPPADGSEADLVEYVEALKARHRAMRS